MTRKNFFTPAEVCTILSISRKTLARWLAAGKIEAVELPSDDPRGRRYRFRRSELGRLLGADFDQNGKGGE